MPTQEFFLAPSFTVGHEQLEERYWFHFFWYSSLSQCVPKSNEWESWDLRESSKGDWTSLFLQEIEREQGRSIKTQKLSSINYFHSSTFLRFSCKPYSISSLFIFCITQSWKLSRDFYSFVRVVSLLFSFFSDSFEVTEVLCILLLCLLSPSCLQFFLWRKEEDVNGNDYDDGKQSLSWRDTLTDSLLLTRMTTQEEHTKKWKSSKVNDNIIFKREPLSDSFQFLNNSPILFRQECRCEFYQNVVTVQRDLFMSPKDKEVVLLHPQGQWNSNDAFEVEKIPVSFRIHSLFIKGPSFWLKDLLEICCWEKQNLERGFREENSSTKANQVIQKFCFFRTKYTQWMKKRNSPLFVQLWFPLFFVSFSFWSLYEKRRLSSSSQSWGLLLPWKMDWSPLTSPSFFFIHFVSESLLMHNIMRCFFFFHSSCSIRNLVGNSPIRSWHHHQVFSLPWWRIRWWYLNEKNVSWRVKQKDKT